MTIHFPKNCDSSRNRRQAGDRHALIRSVPTPIRLMPSVLRPPAFATVTRRSGSKVDPSLAEKAATGSCGSRPVVGERQL